MPKPVIARGNFELLQNGILVYSGSDSRIYWQGDLTVVQDLVGGGIIASFPDPENSISVVILNNNYPVGTIQEPVYCYPVGPQGPPGPIGPSGPNTVMGLIASGAGITITGSGTSVSPYVLSTTGGGTGTVTSVGMMGDGVIYNTTVNGSPVTTTGTLVPTLKSQSQNTFLAAPSTTAGTPTFRAIVSSDIPTLNQSTTGQAGTVATIAGLITHGSNITITGSGTSASPYTISGSSGTGTVTSVGLSVPNFLSVTGSPVTSSGTIAVSLTTQTANTVFAGPGSGAAALPTFRPLVVADIPTLNQNTTGQAGTVATINGLITQGSSITITGSGTSASPYSIAGNAGTVTSVGMTGDGVIYNATVTGSPVTGSGTLVPALLSQIAHVFLCGPTSGSAAPTFRAIVSSDIPTLNQNTTGQAGTVATINGLVAQGSNITITGSGTSASPYTIAGNAGTVTSVAGTSGQITSTGGSTPVIALATAGTAATYGQVTTDAYGRVTSGTTACPVANGGTGQVTLSTHGVLIGEGTSGIGVATTGVAGRILVDQGSSADPVFQAVSGDITLSGSGVAAIKSSVNLSGNPTINAGYGAITTDTYSSTTMFSMATSNRHQLTLTGNSTLAVTGVNIGQVFLVRLIQGSSGSHTVTWWSGIKWPSGTAPTLTLGAGKADVFVFHCTASGAYDGFIVGQNL